MANGVEFYSVKRRQGLRALYAHRAFPAMVAASFAAILGLGSLMLPADLIGRLLAAGGMTAAAPLAFSARATIAIAGALAGTALGLSVARRVARSRDGETRSRPVLEMAQRCRPIDVAEDLGEEGIAETELADAPFDRIPLDADVAAPDRLPTAEIGELVSSDRESSLADLGLMQLTARLGASLNERRIKARRLSAWPLPASPVIFDAVEASNSEEAAQAIATFFSPAPSSGPDHQEPTAESR